MTNEALLQALDRSGLIADDVLAQLRQQVASGRLEPAAIVRQLINDGHLTKAQAERLLGAAPRAPRNATIEINPDEELEELEVIDDDVPGLQAMRNPSAAAADELEVLPDNDEDLLPPPPPPKSKRQPSPRGREPETRAMDDELGLEPIGEDPLLSSPLQEPSAARTKPAKKAAGSSAKQSSRKRRLWRNEVAPAAPELDDQVDDLLGAAASDKAGAGLSNRAAKRATQQNARKGWDSPLMLIGGGSLLLLLIIGTVVYLLTRVQTGDAALDQAETDFKNASFGQAIFKYDQYLERYPKHGSVGIARVHRGIAQMLQANETKDWPKALATAKSVLEQISQETDFSTVQEHLASALPAIANGLAARAREKPSAELVDQTREAVALVEKFVPVNMQPTEQLRDIEASTGLTVRRLAREDALNASLEKMRQSVAAGSAPDAYAARRELLQVYPELVDDKRLLAEMEAAAEGQRTVVKYVEERRPPATDEVPSPTIASVALSSTTGVPSPVEETDAVLILDSGTVYALDPRTGRPRWRRFVGFETTFVPQIVKTAAGSAALALDTTARGIVLVDANSGKLRWRQAIDDGPPAPPVVLRDRVLVATKSGKLLMLDIESGQMLGYVQIPQPLRVGPVIGPRERLLYQVAEQANLYVLAADGSQCREVFYLAHEAGNIAVAPVVTGRYVILAENNGVEDSVLRVLLANDEGLKLQAVDQTSLRGHVLSPPVVSGRALIVATDRGALYTFELGAPDSGRIMTKLAEKPPEDKQPIIPFVASRGTELWLGGYGLTRYNIQAARGALSPKWINDDQSVVLNAPRVAGQTVIYATRSPRTPGVVATAINGADSSRFWQTRLAVPLAAPPIVSDDATKAVVMTSAGAVYDVPAERLASRKLIDAPAAALSENVNMPQGRPLVQLADRRCVFAMSRPDASEGLRDVLIYDPSASDRRLRRKTLPQPAANYPVAFADGLLVPGKIGQVFVVDPDTGRNLLEPFQPVVEVGRDIAWTEPTVLDEKQVLISDGAATLYRLEVVDAPRRHFEAAATATLTAPLVSSLAVAGDFVYAVDASYKLLSFRLPDLAPAKDWRLDAHPEWGPRTVGDQALVATLTGQTTCLSKPGEMAWQIPLPQGRIIGSPYTARGAIVAGSSHGEVYRLAPDSGKVLTEMALRQPLAVGPVLWHERLLFADSDGTLHIIAEPK